MYMDIKSRCFEMSATLALFLILLSRSEALLGDNANQKETFAELPEIEINVADEMAHLSDYMIGAGIEDVNHELYGGIYAQMIFGESFEEPAGATGVSGSGGPVEPFRESETTEQGSLAGLQEITWLPYGSGLGEDVARFLGQRSHTDRENEEGVSSTCKYQVSSDAFNGKQSQMLTGQSGCAIINAGLNTQGMSIVANATYQGYIFAKLSSSLEVEGGAAAVSVALADALPGKSLTILGSQTFNMSSPTWQMFNFSIEASKETTCYNDPAPLTPCHATQEGVCVGCSGRFIVSINSPTAVSVLVDDVYLEKKRMSKTAGPIREDIGQELFNMGVTVLRLGGSMANAADYRWKNFRGPRFLRQPYRGAWYGYASPGYRMFEFLQYTEAHNILGVVTVNINEEASDMADLVEYAFGNSSTKWGKLRIDDGHPEPYEPFWIEIGNEVGDFNLVAHQVAAIARAMISRATMISLKFRLSFCIGSTWNFQWLTDKAMLPIINATQYITKADWYWDFHIAGDLGASSASQPSGQGLTDFLKSKRDLFNRRGSPMRAVVLEENGGHHDLSRALGHARNANRLQQLGNFVRVDSAANCLQALGRNDNGWDQGQVFYLPNMTWLSPHGYSQVMLRQHFLPAAVVVNNNQTWNGSLDVAAFTNANHTQLAIRVVNFKADPFLATLRILAFNCVTMSTPVHVTEMSGQLGDVNTPGQPTKTSPKMGEDLKFANIDPQKIAVLNVTLKAYSFTILSAACTS